MNKLEDLIEEIMEFLEARGWDPNEPDIAKSIVIEASELLELYQWHPLSNTRNYEKAGEEISDVFWYLVMLCKKADLDLSEVVKDKIKKLEEKYPENKFNGKHNSSFYRKQKEKYRKKRNK